MKNTNYFGRICRFLGRINLFVGFILCIGLGTLLMINPFISHDAVRSIQTTTQNNTAKASSSFFSSLGQNQILSWFVTGIIISAATIAIIYLAKKYNAVSGNEKECIKTYSATTSFTTYISYIK